jgi:septum formation protein
MAEIFPPYAARLVLASGSRFRKAMLESAGLSFDVVPAVVDEAGIRARLAAERPELSPAEIAGVLAEAKAREVSRRRPGSLVVGADQILALDGAIFAKPATIDEARAHLKQFRGRVHTLQSAVVLMRDDVVLWPFVEGVRMHVRPFSDAFLETYLAAMGDRALHTVGAYALEGLGGQLFDRIEGDYFTVIGLPLLPLLAALRREGVIAT